MLDVFVFMLSVDSLNQMINPLPRQQGFTGALPGILVCGVTASPEVGPTTWLTGSPRVQGGNWTRGFLLCFLQICRCTNHISCIDVMMRRRVGYRCVRRKFKSFSPRDSPSSMLDRNSNDTDLIQLYRTNPLA